MVEAHITRGNRASNLSKHLSTKHTELVQGEDLTKKMKPRCYNIFVRRVVTKDLVKSVKERFRLRETYVV